MTVLVILALVAAVVAACWLDAARHDATRRARQAEHEAAMLRVQRAGLLQALADRDHEAARDA